MTDQPHAPGNWRNLALSFDEALARVPDALKQEGFGIITQIDMQETFKAKLGVDFRRYRILGACNPTFARSALDADLRIGVLLPCNVVVYERDDGRATVGAIDPMQTLGASAATDAKLAEIAHEVAARLARALAQLPAA